MTLTLAQANKIVAAAIAQARQFSIIVNVAVCENQGHLIAFNRMDRGYAEGDRFAIGKEVASAGTGPPSGEIGSRVDHPPVAEVVAEGVPAIYVRGGLPIFRGGQIEEHAASMGRHPTMTKRKHALVLALLEQICSISGIACVPKIILGLASGEITRERSDPAVQARNCPLRHLTQIGLELAKRHLDRVQIRGILRQITKDGATRFNRFAHACCLVCRKVVHDHGVVTPQSWSQVVLHIIEERLSLHSPVNYIWRCHSLAA